MYAFFHVHANVHTHARKQVQHHTVRAQVRLRHFTSSNFALSSRRICIRIIKHLLMWTQGSIGWTQSSVWYSACTKRFIGEFIFEYKIFFHFVEVSQHPTAWQLIRFICFYLLCEAIFIKYKEHMICSTHCKPCFISISCHWVPNFKTHKEKGSLKNLAGVHPISYMYQHQITRKNKRETSQHANKHKV